MIDQFNKDNIKILQELGYEVHVATNFENPGTITSERSNQLKKYLEKEKVKYYQVDFDRNPLNLTEFKKAKRQLRQLSGVNDYEFVHLHSPIGGIIGRIIFGKSKTKVIYTAHGFHFFKGAPLKNWLIYYPIEKYFSRCTDILITINAEDYNFSQKKLKAKRTEFINGVGVDTKLFKQFSEEEKEKIRNKNGFNNDDFLLIYVGELSQRKNQDYLIDVMSEIKKKEIKLLLVGKGPLEETLKQKVKEKNLEENISFLGYRSDVSDLMGMSDVVVSASKQEGLPVNLIEGLCEGKPLIVSDCRGNRDLVEDGVNGFVIGEYSDKNFSDKVFELYYSDRKRNEFSYESIGISKKYDIKYVHKQMLEIYKCEDV
ncbi:capsular polysaccharide biosynthesis protein [Vagococcus fluvialis bH819]|uniref:Capsular polysaccharide biosynthesis protein n=2 Tax=Enterococcaceae TaxID=81852 RepID=A0A1X6WLV0_9ENTE|nr:capsular polysaccharide biosynthesis protein [Vagococcus fluvialis bH819]